MYLPEYVYARVCVGVQLCICVFLGVFVCGGVFAYYGCNNMQMGVFVCGGVPLGCVCMWRCVCILWVPWVCLYVEV